MLEIAGGNHHAVDVLVVQHLFEVLVAFGV